MMRFLACFCVFVFRQVRKWMLANRLTPKAAFGRFARTGKEERTHFMYKTGLFAKTGSGQTWGKHSKRERDAFSCRGAGEDVGGRSEGRAADRGTAGHAARELAGGAPTPLD